MEIRIPRDRSSTFEPQLVKKYEKDISNIESQIISMYDRGMSTRDISSHIQEIYGMIVSMSHKGDCWDNSMIESFWATIKKELIYREKYKTRAEAEADIRQYIEVFYNRIRIHSALEYMSPTTYLRHFYQLLVAA